MINCAISIVWTHGHFAWSIWTWTQVFLFEMVLVESGQSLNSICFIILCVFVCMGVCVCVCTCVRAWMHMKACFYYVEVRGHCVGADLSFRHVGVRIKLRLDSKSLYPLSHLACPWSQILNLTSRLLEFLGTPKLCVLDFWTFSSRQRILNWTSKEFCMWWMGWAKEL